MLRLVIGLLALVLALGPGMAGAQLSPSGWPVQVHGYWNNEEGAGITLIEYQIPTREARTLFFSTDDDGESLLLGILEIYGEFYTVEQSVPVLRTTDPAEPWPEPWRSLPAAERAEIEPFVYDAGPEIVGGTTGFASRSDLAVVERAWMVQEQFATGEYPGHAVMAMAGPRQAEPGTDQWRTVWLMDGLTANMETMGLILDAALVDGVAPTDVDGWEWLTPSQEG